MDSDKIHIKAFYPGDVGIQEILAIRNKVFTLEQGIPASIDIDGKDTLSIHALLEYENTSAGTGRLFIKDGLGQLARIAILKPFRGRHLARHIIKFLEETGRSAGVDTFELYPHDHLFNFYAQLGFQKDASYKDEVAGHKLIRMFKNVKK